MENKNPYTNAKSMAISKLEEILLKLADEYYNTGKSDIDDKTYDGMLEILRSRKPNSNVLTRIGARTKRSIKLPLYTGSLDKVKNIESWTTNYKGSYIISDKLDGVSCVIVKTMTGINMYTRGDGEYGSDITHLQYLLLNKITKTDIPPGTVIRGELIISKTNFEKIASQMKNARNAVSGLVNSKKINLDIANLTEFVAYNIMVPEFKQSIQLEKLKKYGLQVVNYKNYTNIDTAILSKILLDRRDNSIYDIDGIVVTDNSQSYSIQNNTNPEYAFAFKSVITEDTAEVLVHEVKWNVSKDGYIKPMIKIEPVELSGVKISSITGNNAKYIVDNKIGPNSKLLIVRSGGVIPKVIKILEYADEPDMPTYKYSWNDTGVDIIATSKSNDKNIKLITFFFKKINVKNIDEATVKKLVDNGYDTLIKILNIDVDKINIEGIGVKSITKILTNANKCLNNTNMETLMYASQCFGRGLGIKKLQNIFEKYDYNNILIKQQTNLLDMILNIDGFDTKTATQFVNNINKFNKFYDSLNKVINLSYLFKEKPKITSDKPMLLKGEIIVFTGVRDKDLEEFIEKNGGTVKSAVSSKTTILIYKDNMAMTNKLLDAKTNGVKLFTINEFNKKYLS